MKVREFAFYVLAKVCNQMSKSVDHLPTGLETKHLP